MLGLRSMPSLDSVTFDTTGLTLAGEEREAQGDAREWTSARGDNVGLMYIPMPGQIPAAARQTPEGLLRYWATKAEQAGGEHLETLLCNVEAGPVVISMAKFPMRPA